MYAQILIIEVPFDINQSCNKMFDRDLFDSIVIIEGEQWPLFFIF
jgi:3-deoxy-D-manno-octulosonic-acid transferase